ncbi:transposase [Streptococcus pneumoniae BHN427]|nr:transposase [Streptococcus pneumoniae BHN427]
MDRKSHEYKAIKRYWKLIQQDSRKLSDKHFYRPTFRMHLTNKEILNKLLSYSQDLKHHYQLYQLLLFHFQNKEPEKFFGLIEDNLKQVHPLFQTVFKTFLKDKEKIVNALQLHYSNAKLEATNNLIKLIKRNAFGFRNFENFKKRIFIALNIKKERTSRFILFFRLSLKPSSKIKKRLSTPFNYTILMPNWKRPIISSNLSSAMPLVFETLKTSKNGFLSP